jgi:hypothetical protein
MAIIGKTQLIVVMGIAAAVGISEGDKAVNYTQIDAVVTKSAVDCYVKDGKKYLAEKATDKMAYMDCEIAPFAAKEFGYPESAVKKRSQYEFAYVSPVDGSKQKGKDTNEHAEIKQGQKIKIYAHKEEPGKSRM